MKKILGIILLLFATGFVCAQKTMLVEKIGGSQRYYYHTGDYLKLRVSKQDTLLKGRLWSIHDSVISVEELRPFDVRLGDIGSVYKQFAFPNKFGRYIMIGGGVIFGIIGINHLLNNEPLFSPDMLIISGSMVGAGLISLSLSQKRCRTDHGWKVKVLNIKVK
ncbi:MAG: hypothetical protein NT040_13670 [Bacteroidetes bacterium]|nr:hypothetical protein [Bacteroidota bacterium]